MDKDYPRVVCNIRPTSPGTKYRSREGDMQSSQSGHAYRLLKLFACHFKHRDALPSNNMRRNFFTGDRRSKKNLYEDLFNPPYSFDQTLLSNSLGDPYHQSQ